MISYTIYDLGMNVGGKKYILPLDKSVSDDEIMDKVKNLFNDIYMRQSTDIKKNQMEIKCLYEGYDGYYPYIIHLEFFRLKYDMSNQTQRLVEKKKKDVEDGKEVDDGQWMISIYTDNEQGSLLEELLDLKILPEIVKKIGLKDYSYKKNII
jgi:hypothetical protein